uniref:PX domain-containing protein n=1 Tax=Peronospora matthiolae TaxID=2874970 RepID=A0AAV1VP37_9STRA
MGCIHSTDSTRSYRVNSVAIPLRPSTPSFHAKDLTQPGVSTTGSRTNNEPKDDVPSFVVSNSADLVGSSDGEMVYGMVRTFTFSYIQASETSSTHSSLGDVSYAPDEEPISPARAPGSLSSALIVGGDPIVELTPIPEERLNRKGGGNGRASGSTATKADASPLSSSSGTENGESSIGSDLEVIESMDASDSSHYVEGVSCNSASESSEESRHAVIETSCKESDAYELMRRKVIEADAVAIVQEIIEAAVVNVTIALEQQQTQDEQVLVKRSSLQLEPLSTGLSRNTPHSCSAPILSHRPLTYAIVGTSLNNGVVWYRVQCMTEEVLDSSKRSAPLLRRYSRFSAMYRQLKATKLPTADKLPELSQPGLVHFVRGRQSKKTIQEREAQLSNVLHYIAKYRELHESSVFQSFLAQ